jgi:hypothetical protein
MSKLTNNPKKKEKEKKQNADLPRTAIHNNLQQSGWATGRVSRERSRSGGNTDHTTRAEQNQLPVLTGKGSSQSKCGRISNALCVLQGARGRRGREARADEECRDHDSWLRARRERELLRVDPMAQVCRQIRRLASRASQQGSWEAEETKPSGKRFVWFRVALRPRPRPWTGAVTWAHAPFSCRSRTARQPRRGLAACVSSPRRPCSHACRARRVTSPTDHRIGILMPWRPAGPSVRQREMVSHATASLGLDRKHACCVHFFSLIF